MKSASTCTGTKMNAENESCMKYKVNSVQGNIHWATTSIYQMPELGLQRQVTSSSPNNPITSTKLLINLNESKGKSCRLLIFFCMFISKSFGLKRLDSLSSCIRIKKLVSVLFGALSLNWQYYMEDPMGLWKSPRSTLPVSSAFQCYDLEWFMAPSQSQHFPLWVELISSNIKCVVGVLDKLQVYFRCSRIHTSLLQSGGPSEVISPAFLTAQVQAQTSRGAILCPYFTCPVSSSGSTAPNSWR